MAIVFEAPVPIRAEVREIRKRHTRNATFVESVPVRVAGASAADAPLALRATDLDGRDYIYRDFGGGLVRSLRVPTADGPALVTAGNIREAMRSFSAFAARPGAWAEILPTDWPFLDRPAHTGAVTRREDWYEVLGTDRDEACAAYRAAWSGAVLVDGVIHVRSRGPAWIVRTEGGLPWPGWPDARRPIVTTEAPQLALVPERAHLVREDPAWTFAPGEIRIARIRVDEGLATRSLPGHGAYLRWVGPQASEAGSASGPALLSFRADGGLPTAEIAAAARAMLNVAARGLHALSPDGIRAYAALKEECAANAEAPRPAALLAALREAHAAWSGRLRDGPAEEADPAGALLGRIAEGRDDDEERGPEPGRSPGR